MKTHRHVLLAALLISPVGVGLTSTMSAQDIVFRSVQPAINDPRKRYPSALEVCVFNEADQILVIGRQCWILDKGQAAKWNRGGDKSKFHVRVRYRYELSTRCSRRDVPGNVLEVNVAFDPCQISLVSLATGPAPTPAPKTPLESVLTVCNQSIGEKVNFAIAYIVDVSVGGGATHVLAEGWWELEKGECKAIPWSDRMKKWRNPELPADLTINPRFFIYAETEGLFGGAIKRVMEGDESDPDDISVCINSAKNFEYRQQPTNSPRFGMAAEKKCMDKRIRMANVPRHSEDLSEFRWTF